MHNEPDDVWHTLQTKQATGVVGCKILQTTDTLVRMQVNTALTAVLTAYACNNGADGIILNATLTLRLSPTVNLT